MEAREKLQALKGGIGDAAAVDGGNGDAGASGGMAATTSTKVRRNSDAGAATGDSKRHKRESSSSASSSSQGVVGAPVVAHPVLPPEDEKENRKQQQQHQLQQPQIEVKDNMKVVDLTCVSPASSEEKKKTQLLIMQRIFQPTSHQNPAVMDSLYEELGLDGSDLDVAMLMISHLEPKDKQRLADGLKPGPRGLFKAASFFSLTNLGFMTMTLVIRLRPQPQS